MELDSASEPSELNYEQGEPEPIYDSHQREKSTGSGLVLAVPLWQQYCVVLLAPTQHHKPTPTACNLPRPAKVLGQLSSCAGG